MFYCVHCSRFPFRCVVKNERIQKKPIVFKRNENRGETDNWFIWNVWQKIDGSRLSKKIQEKAERKKRKESKNEIKRKKKTEREEKTYTHRERMGVWRCVSRGSS